MLKQWWCDGIMLWGIAWKKEREVVVKRGDKLWCKETELRFWPPLLSSSSPLTLP